MMHVLVMGICGVGKSTVGRALAERLGATFVEGDAFHSQANIERMAAGLPLNDAMREGWLDAIAWAAVNNRKETVIACSALKDRYRDRLIERIGDCVTVHLTGAPDLLARRVSQRADHFMPASLVETQLADLEPPSGPHVVTIDVALPQHCVIETALSYILAAQENFVN